MFIFLYINSKSLSLCYEPTHLLLPSHLKFFSLAVSPSHLSSTFFSLTDSFPYRFNYSSMLQFWIKKFSSNRCLALAHYYDIFPSLLQKNILKVFFSFNSDYTSTFFNLLSNPTIPLKHTWQDYQCSCQFYSPLSLI